MRICLVVFCLLGMLFFISFLVTLSNFFKENMDDETKNKYFIYLVVCMFGYLFSSIVLFICGFFLQKYELLYAPLYGLAAYTMGKIPLTRYLKLFTFLQLLIVLEGCFWALNLISR